MVAPTVECIEGAQSTVPCSTLSLGASAAMTPLGKFAIKDQNSDCVSTASAPESQQGLDLESRSVLSLSSPGTVGGLDVLKSIVPASCAPRSRRPPVSASAAMAGTRTTTISTPAKITVGFFWCVKCLMERPQELITYRGNQTICLADVNSYAYLWPKETASISH